MTRSEYNYEAFASIKTETEALLHSLRIDRFLIEKLISEGSSYVISDEDTRLLHTFNTAALASISGVMVSRPEMSFGFSDKAVFSISYRNYSLSDYLSLIRFKETELGIDMDKDLITAQFIALLEDVKHPFSPSEMVNWIFKDLSFTVILYSDDTEYTYKKVYSPEFSKMLSLKNVQVLASAISFNEKYTKSHNERKASFVNRFNKSVRKCKSSSLSGLAFSGYIYDNGYSGSANIAKWRTVTDEVDMTQNPFFEAIESRSNIVRPNLVLVGA